MKETALDRVSRALNLIPFIAANPGLSIQQIAERFDSTPAQISKDLTLLHMCGLPGYTHLELLDIDYEDPEYVSVLDPQVLDHPRSLSQTEALTLVLGLELLSEIAKDPAEREAISKLQERISKIIGDDFARAITIADGVVESPIMKDLELAISNSKFIQITYNSASSDTVTTRTVFPTDLFFKDGIGYIQALMKDSVEMRTFRIDRIIELELGESDPTFAERSHSSSNEEIEIEIEMGGDGIFFLEKHNEIVTSSKEINGTFFLNLQVNSSDWIKRVISSWPGRITVAKPVDLAKEIEDITRAALQNYS
jgi:proteasome accessory factor C